jgi:hypothetical protein
MESGENATLIGYGSNREIARTADDRFLQSRHAVRATAGDGQWHSPVPRRTELSDYGVAQFNRARA